MDKLIKALRSYLSLVNKSGADFFRPDVLNLYHVLANAELDYRMEQKEEPKMTREEAVKKVVEALQNFGPYRSTSTIEADLITLEALGLIKFDEPAYVFKDKNGIEFKVHNTFVRIEK